LLAIFLLKSGHQKIKTVQNNSPKLLLRSINKHPIFLANHLIQTEQIKNLNCFVPYKLKATL